VADIFGLARPSAALPGFRRRPAVPPPPTALEKAVIVDTTTGASLPVMYNPEELKLEQGNSFAEVGIPGLDAPPTQYVRGKARTLAMELFYDTYETGEDVRVHTTPLVRLLEKRPETQAPPVVLFSMGRFQFRCVLVEATQRFTMFGRDGTPVRSSVAVRFQEHVRVDIEVRRGLFFASPTASAVANRVADTARAVASGAATVHVVGPGETLSGLAAVLLGDPARWREIAEANDIDDPFDLVPGRRLILPGGPAARPQGGP
jgi:hypothetical protein